MKLKGNIVFSKSLGSTRGVRLEIRDNDSGARFLEAYMSLETFADAITGTCTDFEFDVRGLSVLGKKQEVKRELVDCPPWIRTTDQEWQAALAQAVMPYEVEGWKADIDKQHNGHKTKGEKYEVIFRRYV